MEDEKNSMPIKLQRMVTHPESPFSNIDFVYTTEEYQTIIEAFEHEIQEIKTKPREKEPKDLNLLTLHGTINGLRAMLSQVQEKEQHYRSIIESKHYYTFYYVNTTHELGSVGDICLVLDGEPTDHIMPYDNLDELQENINAFIYDNEDTEKYEPIRSLVGDRPLLPIPWYIKLYILELEKSSNELPESITTALEKIIPVQTKNILSTIDKITGSIAKGEIEPNTGKKTGLKVGGGYVAGVMLSFDVEELGGLSTKGKLNPFDMEVFKAVCSIYQAGNAYISVGMINNFLAGKSIKLNDSQKDRIEESMKKLMNTRILIDPTKEAQSYGLDEFSYEEPMIAAGVLTQRLKGNEIKFYLIKNVPILFSYASKKKQLYSLPVELLNTPISKNEDTIVLQGYLMDRIQPMKRSRLNNSINYDTVLDYVLGYKLEGRSEAAIKKKRSDLIKKIKAILDDWIAKDFISSYKEYGKGRSKEGVSIYWDSKKRGSAK